MAGPRTAAFLLVGLVLIGLAVQTATSSAPPRTAASPTPAAVDPAVAAAISRVERAFNAGDVALLCRPGALVDGAVIRRQGPGRCQSRIETLMGTESPMRLSVRSVVRKQDLATAVVATRPGTTASVDLVRRGASWLLSFSDGADPMPALAGTG